MDTQPHLEFPTLPLPVERGVLLPTPVPSRIGALFSSSPLPPTSVCTGSLSPKFCLKLELVKGLLKFHGNLLWFEGMTRYFPRSYHRSRMWVLGPALDNDFRVVPPALPILLWLWGFCQTRGSLPPCLSRACYVEGLSCWTARSQRTSKACSWRAACPVGPK